LLDGRLIALSLLLENTKDVHVSEPKDQSSKQITCVATQLRTFATQMRASLAYILAIRI
jgi:hypothetical protein